MTDRAQIEEMAQVIDASIERYYKIGYEADGDTIAPDLYAAGYRKQTEAEWIERIEKPSWLEDDVEVYYNCSMCGTSHWISTTPFCPNCGAKMKGGE